ncbi:MAG: YezD family protein [Candidatus Omnitrophica bacterium]|nr:YezD family protein [Candidatus Omnitrophota bacterium]
MMKADQSVLDEIIGCIQQVRYGEVVVTIHDAQVVQVEKREKMRFKDRHPLHVQGSREQG